MNHRLFNYGGAIALLCLSVACTAPTSPSDTETEADNSEIVADRSAYGEISLPPDAQRFGRDLEIIAIDAFGTAEIPTEGNFSQAVTIVEQTTTDAIVTLTQTGLLDDSVEGVRYWLEFEAGENAWEMVWAGRQVRCYPGRGSQDWSMELCI